MDHRPATRLPPGTLVLGGARAGKSRYAEGLIDGSGAPTAVYIATAQPGDIEMATRIAAHRAQRSGNWLTVEEPLALADAVSANVQLGRPILVDCLTLWLSNLLGAGEDPDEATDHLLHAMADAPCPVILVSNEVGLGIVPDNALAREFRDYAGRLHQRIATEIQRVVFVAAGLPLLLKDRPVARDWAEQRAALGAHKPDHA
ncbi:MAG: bifunctional adenosylcobinamide kinase/adenosylcobinamide-phosphate guanylyltransferase [Rhodospirillales bacterium]